MDLSYLKYYLSHLLLDRTLMREIYWFKSWKIFSTKLIQQPVTRLYSSWYLKLLGISKTNTIYSINKCIILISIIILEIKYGLELKPMGWNKSPWTNLILSLIQIKYRAGTKTQSSHLIMGSRNVLCIGTSFLNPDSIIRTFSL